MPPAIEYTEWLAAKRPSQRLHIGFGLARWDTVHTASLVPNVRELVRDIGFGSIDERDWQIIAGGDFGGLRRGWGRARLNISQIDVLREGKKE